MTTRPSGTTPTPMSANGWAIERISSPPCAASIPPCDRIQSRGRSSHLKRPPTPGPAVPAAQPPFEIDQAGVTRPVPRQRRRGDVGLMPAYPAPHPDHMPGAQIFEPEGAAGGRPCSRFVLIDSTFWPSRALPPAFAGAGSARQVSRPDPSSSRRTPPGSYHVAKSAFFAEFRA
jgi:hypothetical protein